MSKNLKFCALLAGGTAGAVIGHHYDPATPMAIFFGALMGAFVIRVIIELTT
jgi:hypothetical protein